MPEIKRNFLQGKMNKDLDERLIPNGQYRDALNVEVSTSEGSDVGTVKNILGNKRVETLVPRLTREKFAAVRKAKLRLSNIKLEELTQILRGKSKQIKH